MLLITQRFSLKYLLTGSFNKLGKDKENILIYGAGAAGRQLFTSLEANPKYNVVGFLDDNPNMHRQNLLGKRIYNPKNIRK